MDVPAVAERAPDILFPGRAIGYGQFEFFTAMLAFVFPLAEAFGQIGTKWYPRGQFPDSGAAALRTLLFCTMQCAGVRRQPENMPALMT